MSKKLASIVSKQINGKVRNLLFFTVIASSKLHFARINAIQSQAELGVYNNILICTRNTAQTRFRYDQGWIYMAASSPDLRAPLFISINLPVVSDAGEHVSQLIIQQNKRPATSSRRRVDEISFSSSSVWKKNAVDSTAENKITLNIILAYYKERSPHFTGFRWFCTAATNIHN
jgi:hypothetical protein